MKAFEAHGLVLELIAAVPGASVLPVVGLRLAELHVQNDAVELEGSFEPGWRRYLPEAGTRRLSLVAEGLILNRPAEQQLRSLALTGAAQRCRIALDGGLEMLGLFIVREMSMSDRHGDEPTHRLTLESSGEIITA